MDSVQPLSPPSRVLMGPGPSDVAPSVLRALAAPTVGHLDPAFLKVMDEVRAMLRVVFGTENEITLPMSATGSAGMETRPGRAAARPCAHVCCHVWNRRGSHGAPRGRR